MFGKNQITGQKYFNNADDKLLITSIFLTLQGEGPFRGMPAVFVRFAKCNLQCGWCDTFFDAGDWLTVEQIQNKIDELIDKQYNNTDKSDIVLVVTGGEPMLQKNIVDLLEWGNKYFYATQIESNGTLLQDIPKQTYLVVSPKCLERKGKPIKYLEIPEKVKERADCFKFVMSADQSSPYSSIPDYALNSEKQVFVSPMNIYNKEPEKAKQLRSQKNDITLEQRSTTDEVISFWEPGLLDMTANQKNHEYTAQYCLEHKLIFNMQLHLFASLA